MRVLRRGRRPIPVGGVHAVGIVFGNDLVAEQLEELEDLVAVKVLGEPEHELVAADGLVGLELLGDLVGIADHHVAARDQLVEERVRVAAADQVLEDDGALGHVMASGDFGIVS